MTCGGAWRSACELLRSAGVPEAEVDAGLLLEYACGVNRGDLLAHGDRPLDAGKQEAYFGLVEKRCSRIPLQYLTGVQNFMGLDFLVDEHVLIPRQDTEILAEEALKHLHDGMRILDLCTGSGCILISLLHYTNGCSGVGVDLSGEALALADRNAGRLLWRSAGEDDTAALGGTYESCSFRESDLFERVDGVFDMIVSNPPYIKSGELDGLMPEVRDYEPKMALDGGGDGLTFYRRIIGQCREYLRRGGMLLFEIGCGQGEAVSRLMEQAGFLEVQVIKDYGGLDRVVSGTLGIMP